MTKNISISSQFSYEFDSIELHSCFILVLLLFVVIKMIKVCMCNYIQIMILKGLNSLYSLTCELYPNQLVSDLILDAGNFNDLTLVCDDGLYCEEFPANKSILSTECK